MLLLDQTAALAIDAVLNLSAISRAVIEAGCIIGPHARLRPGTILKQGVKIGNFVETKNAHFEAGAKANHLSYLGDAHIGTQANIGAGTITCNYDGFNKSRTEIGAYAFIGSNSAWWPRCKLRTTPLLVPARSLPKVVEAHALGLSRAEQKTYPMAAKRFHARAQKVKDQKAKDQKEKDKAKDMTSDSAHLVQHVMDLQQKSALVIGDIMLDRM